MEETGDGGVRDAGGLTTLCTAGSRMQDAGGGVRDAGGMAESGMRVA